MMTIITIMTIIRVKCRHLCGPSKGWASRNEVEVKYGRILHPWRCGDDEIFAAQKMGNKRMILSSAACLGVVDDRENRNSGFLGTGSKYTNY